MAMPLPPMGPAPFPPAGGPGPAPQGAGAGPDLGALLGGLPGAGPQGPAPQGLPPGGPAPAFGCGEKMDVKA